MSFTSIGDLSNSLRLRYFSANLNRQANQLGLQMATGQHADIPKSLNGDLRMVTDLNRSLSLLSSYARTAGEMSNRAETIQIALKSAQTMADEAASGFQLAAVSAADPSVANTANDARAQLQSVIGALNSDLAGSHLFSGEQVGLAPFGTAEELLDLLEPLVAGAIDGADAFGIVTGFFHDAGGGFETSFYQGSVTPSGAVNVSASESVSLAINGLDPAFRDLLSGFATAALIDRGILGGQEDQQADLMRLSGETLSRAAFSLVDLQADTGSQQARLEQITVRIQAERSGQEIALNALRAADPYETATALQAVEIQLESLYIATSRLSQLSLTRYLS